MSDFDVKMIENLRKELHKNPEVSGKEFETASRITAFLRKNKADEVLTSVAETGIIGIYRGKKGGKNILFRCELDALPITEINSFEHKSKVPNISHKCGHDGHMAILCGLAQVLAKNTEQKGDIFLLFQPAEEDGKGAKKVLEDPKFKALKIDYIFALHNLPGFDLNQIIFKENTFSCAVNSIVIKLEGKTSHAGEPENGINPALAISQIIQKFQNKNQPDINKDDFCIITPIYINMGKKAYGVAAGYGEIHFTVRSNSNEKMAQIERQLENYALEISNSQRLKTAINWTQEFKANENNKQAVFFLRDAITAANFNFLEKENPFTWGEDFGILTENFKGAMFGLGAGKNTPSLHNPDYDFPDEILAAGVTIFDQISKVINNA